jgi:hypothetical protein
VNRKHPSLFMGRTSSVYERVYERVYEGHIEKLVIESKGIKLA